MFLFISSICSKDHKTYAQHSCEEGYVKVRQRNFSLHSYIASLVPRPSHPVNVTLLLRMFAILMLLFQDVKVPVCPLCSQPVPVNRGEDPNIKVINDSILCRLV